MIDIILFILGALVVFAMVFAIVVAMRPAEFRITRSATISAPPAELFAQVNDFHKWDAWSPWAKLDPTMKQTYEGARPDPAPSTPGLATTWWAQAA